MLLLLQLLFQQASSPTLAIILTIKTHVVDNRQIMMLHGLPELSKPHQEEILSGEKAIKIIIFLLAMLDLLIHQVEPILQWLLVWTLNSLSLLNISTEIKNPPLIPFSFLIASRVYWKFELKDTTEDKRLQLLS